MKRMNPGRKTAKYFGMLLALLGACVSLWLPAAARAEAPGDDGWALAMESGVKGRGGWTTCYAFARSLQERFTLAGGESHLVVYDWTDEARMSDRHAFLVYRDTAGRYWGIDNRSAKPRWLRGTTPAEWAAFWDADKTTRVVADITDRALVGRAADLGLLGRGALAARVDDALPGNPG